MDKMKIFMSILAKPIEIDLVHFKIKNASNYYLVDTGSALKLLPRLPSILNRLDKGNIALAIPRKTIEQVIEHLMKSFEKRTEQQTGTHDIEKGMRNFVKLIEDRRILKVSNPEKCPNRDEEYYQQFQEDAVLACVLFEGGFKGIVTEDGKLRQKISKRKPVLSYKDLLK
jgi:hypothetical protein